MKITILTLLAAFGILAGCATKSQYAVGSTVADAHGEQYTLVSKSKNQWVKAGDTNHVYSPNKSFVFKVQ